MISLGRTSSSARLLVACTAALAALLVVTATASAMAWKAGGVIKNETPFDLVRAGVNGNNIDKWESEPTKEIASGSWGGFYWESDTFWSPTFARVLYNVNRADGLNLGQVSYEVRIDCIFGCHDYTRSTRGEVLDGAPLRLSWSDNGGAPKDGYYGELKVTERKPGVVPFWKACDDDDLPPMYSSPAVHGVGCGEALRAIRFGDEGNGGRFVSPDWSCRTEFRGFGLAAVTCRGDDGDRFRFDLD